jgi:5-deoxy-glucuronate isomerase
MSPPVSTPRSRSLVRAGELTAHISLDLEALQEGAALELAPGQERLAVVLAGEVGVRIDGGDAGIAGGRADVFDSPGAAVYLPDRAAASLVARGADALVAIASAPVSALPPGPARIITAAEQRVASVGRDTWRRTVRTILGPEDRASRLLVGETVNSPGCWSSYPPHRHDRDSPEEVRLEEVYLFRVRPDNGFGVQVRYESDTDQEARVVRDLDVAVIVSGFHPVAAAPGHELYYLWVMAGQGRELRPYLDPRYRWVDQQG